MRVSVQRLEPAASSQSISWSDDGTLAVSTAAGGVALFSYGANAATGGSERLLRYEIPESEQQLADNSLSHDLSIGIGSTRRETVAVQWSTTGGGPNYSCALAVLKCNGNSYVYCSNAGAGGVWTAVNVGFLVAERAGLSLADPGCAKRLRIRAISWHKTKALLAAASEAGDIYVLEFADGVCRNLAVEQPGPGEPAVALCWHQDQVATALASGAVRSNNRLLYESLKRPVSMHSTGSKLVVLYCALAVTIDGDSVSAKVLRSALPVMGLIPWNGDLVAVFDDGGLESVGQGWSPESLSQVEKKFGLKPGKSEVVRVHGVAVANNIPCAAVLVSNMPDDVWHYPILSKLTSTLRLEQVPGPCPEFNPNIISNVTWKEWLAIAKPEPMEDSRGSWPTGPWESPESALLDVLGSPMADQVRDRILRDFEPALVREMRRQMATAVLSCDLTEHINSDVDEAVRHMLSQLVLQRFDEPHGPLTLSGDGIECTFEFSGQDPSGDEVCDTQNRKWRRCALTRMPLLTCDTHSASESPFVRLNPANYGQGLTKLILSALPFCPFDGSRWKSRQN